MERPQVHSETFAEMLTSEMDIEEHPIKVEPNQLDFLPDEEIASLLNLDLQSKQVKTEADETLTSEIEIVEHPIKFEAGDQIYCLSQSAGMDGTEVTTEATDEMLTSKIEIDELPIRFDPEELDCFDGDSTESSNNPENLQKCYQCLMEYQPKLFTWHTKNCHGSEAVVNIIKHGYIQHTYQCVLCKSAYKKLETAIDHLHLNHQLPNFPHHCKHCNKSFNLWKRLIKHQQSCSVRRNKLLNFVNCVQCDIRYANPELLAWHIENCHGENPIVRIERIGGNKISFQCVYCQESFKESCRIIEHLYRKHQLSNLPYCCSICNKQFVSKYCMKEHKLGCKTNSQAQRLLQIKRADNESLTSEVDIEGHQIKLKPGKIQLNTQNADGLRLQDVNKKYNKKALKCCKCDTNYVFPEILAWHIDHCHGPNAIIAVTHRNKRVIYECVFCKCLFQKFELIIRHLRLQHQFINLPFHCDNCDLKFIGRNYLLKHKQTCKKRQEAPSTHFDQQSLEESPKIDVENQLVKAEPGNDQPSLFMQKMNGMECTDVTTETTEELLTSEIEIVEHPIKFDSEKLDSLQSDGLRLQDVNKKYIKKDLKCYKCDINYAFPEILAWHIDHCHGPNAIIVVTHRNKRVIYECGFCNCSFKKFELIIRHLRLQHQFTNLPFHCNNCDLKFICRTYLLKHKRTCKKTQEVPATHFDQQSLEESPKIDVENQLVKAEPGNDQPSLFMQKMNEMDPALKILACRVLVPKLLECELCRFYTDSKIELTNHMRTHLKPNTSASTRLEIHPVNKEKETKNHKCQQCGVKFYLAEKFVWHNEFCHGSDAIFTIVKINDKVYTYRCDICNSNLKNIDLMITHLKQEHRLKKLPFRCKDCERYFALKFLLRRHQVTCKNKKNYKVTPSHFKPKISSVKCKMCDESFEFEVEMKTHIANFHGVRNKKISHKCLHCDVVFHFISLLKSHCRKNHPGKPILQCDVCKAEFQSHGGYHRHTLYKHSKSVFTCKLCASTFSYPTGLYTHLQNVHSQKTFSCMFCNSAPFKSHFYLIKHLKGQHSNELFHCEHCSHTTRKKSDLCVHIQNCHLKCKLLE